MVSGTPRLRASYALDAGGAWIAQARHLAAEFLTRARVEDGLPVSERVVEITQLVVSELVTNARKYAPGPVGLDLRVFSDTVEVVVRDGNPNAPRPGTPTPGGWGSTAWRSSWPSPRPSTSARKPRARASPPVSPSPPEPHPRGCGPVTAPPGRQPCGRSPSGTRRRWIRALDQSPPGNSGSRPYSVRTVEWCTAPVSVSR